MGKNTIVRREFKGYADLCKKAFIEAGTHNIKVDWGRAKPEVSRTDRSLVSFEAPEDFCYPIHDYHRQFGDPSTNGHGHKRMVLEGMDGVLVPSDGPWKLKRSRQKLVDGKDHRHSKGGSSQHKDGVACAPTAPPPPSPTALPPLPRLLPHRCCPVTAVSKEIFDDGSFTLGEHQAESVFGNITAQLFSTKAAGTSLSALLGATGASSSSSAVAQSSGTSATSLAQGAPSTDDGDDEGGFFSFGLGGAPSETKVAVGKTQCRWVPRCPNLNPLGPFAPRCRAVAAPPIRAWRI